MGLLRSFSPTYPCIAKVSTDDLRKKHPLLFPCLSKGLRLLLLFYQFKHEIGAVLLHPAIRQPVIQLPQPAAQSLRELVYRKEQEAEAAAEGKSLSGKPPYVLRGQLCPAVPGFLTVVQKLTPFFRRDVKDEPSAGLQDAADLPEDPLDDFRLQMHQKMEGIDCIEGPVLETGIVCHRLHEGNVPVPGSGPGKHFGTGVQAVRGVAGEPAGAAGDLQPCLLPVRREELIQDPPLLGVDEMAVAVAEPALVIGIGDLVVVGNDGICFFVFH